MPSFTFVENVLAGASFNPLEGWQYEYLPWAAGVGVLANADVVGLVNTLTSGSETIVEESPVQAGGTAGVIPSPLNTTIQGWQAAAGDRLKLSYRNTTAGAIDLAGIIEIEPL